MREKYLGILAAVVLFGGMGVFYSFFSPEAEETRILEAEADIEPFTVLSEETSEGEEPLETPEASPAFLHIHVCGQVNSPGLYQLGPDSRVADAIEAAGGFTKEARESSVNLARRLQDGEQLYVLSQQESKETAADGQTESRININSASREELLLLPGIGEAKAEAIVAYRSRNGNFNRIEDLKKIEGIKDGVFEKIKDKITI